VHTLPCCCDLAGDADNDGTVDLDDAEFILAIVNGAQPTCRDEADAKG
jgi:hypothetical protein